MEISNIGNIKKSEIDLYRLITKKINKFEEYEIEYLYNKTAANRYIKEILKVTRECFSSESYMFLENNMELILSDKNMNTIIIKHKGILIGYVSYQLKKNHMRLKETIYYNEEIGYIAMCAIVPEYQGKGLYKLATYLMLYNLIEIGAERIFVRTQNAKVFMGIKSMLENFKQYGLLDSYELEFTKYEKALFSGMITENFGVKEIKNIPKEFESINAENGDVGLYLWKIKI